MKPIGGKQRTLANKVTIGPGGLDSYDEFKKVFANNKKLIEEFVLESNEVPVEILESWVEKKAKKTKQQPKPSRGANQLNSWKYSARSDKAEILAEMSGLVDGETKIGEIMFLLAETICLAVDADLFNLYLVETEGEITKHSPEEGDHSSRPVYQIGIGTTIAAYTAYTRNMTRVSLPTEDPNYPHGVGGLKDLAGKVLCHPICSSDGELEAIIELIRTSGNMYTEDDCEIVNSYITWGGLALHYANEINNQQQEKLKSNFFSSIIRTIFTEMTSMNSLIVQSLNQVQKMVDADRASLFLIDTKTNQLYAKLFEVVADESSEANVNEEILAKGDLRFPVGKGIAGHVAETGQPLNVSDVYNDPRFNPEVDEETGYTTHSIFCQPIIIRGTLIGVMEFINKNNHTRTFTQEDETLIGEFGTYIGLALHHAKLYDKIRKAESSVQVGQELCAYYAQARQDEVDLLLAEGKPRQEDHEDIRTQIYSFYAGGLSDMEKVRKAIFMFSDLFGLERYNYNKLVSFLITVKTNYRSVAYHNWAHGFHVCNSIYSILKASPGIFSPVECLGQWVGAICHDLDHRGYNNKFMIDIQSPLAKIYTTSTMENHHFTMGVSILQREENSLLDCLNPEEYKEVLDVMKKAILATDLAMFFPNKARLANIVKDNVFDWEMTDHRMLAMSLCMTGSDLNSSSKPWTVQRKTADIVYAEFHEQGDVEKLLGWKPIPLFDRDNFAELASMQVGFFGGICIPCYELLAKVMPTVQPMVDQCHSNWATWKQLAEERKQEKEKLEMEKKAKEEAEKREAEEAADDGSKEEDEEKK